MSWKYVIVRLGNTEVPVIFPERLVHAHVAMMLRSMFAAEAQVLSNGVLSAQAIQQVAESVVPVAAGSCEIDVFATHGRSETLNLGARPADAAFMNMLQYTGGYVDEGTLDSPDTMKPR